MKKIFCWMTLFFLVAGVANAQTEYYTSIKMGMGDTTIYVNNDDKFGDYLVKLSESNTGHGGYVPKVTILPAVL